MASFMLDRLKEIVPGETKCPCGEAADYLLQTYFGEDKIAMLMTLVRMGVRCSDTQDELRAKVTTDARFDESMVALEAYAASRGAGDADVGADDIPALCALLGALAILPAADQPKYPAAIAYTQAKSNNPQFSDVLGPYILPGTLREGGMIDMRPEPRIVAAASANAMELNKGEVKVKTQRQLEKEDKEKKAKAADKKGAKQPAAGADAESKADAAEPVAAAAAFALGEGVAADQGKDARIACIKSALGGQGIAYELAEHPKVATVEAMEKEIGHLGGFLCKNLFLKAKKKHPKRPDDSQVWLVVAKADSKVNLKALTAALGYPSKGELRMGKDDLLLESLQVVQGEVTPLALINNPGGTVNVVLDKLLVEPEQERLWFHPLSNEASVAISSASLLKYIGASGRKPWVLDTEDSTVTY